MNNIENRLGNLVVSISIGLQFINYILSLVFGVGFISQIIIFLFVLYLIYQLISIKEISALNLRLIFIVLVLLIYFAFYSIIHYESSIQAKDFLAFCLLPLLIGSTTNYKNEVVLKEMMFMLILALPLFSTLFDKANRSMEYDAVSLSTSYGMAPLIAAGAFHYMVYFDKIKSRISRFFYSSLYLICMLYLLFFFKNSYRGPLLSIIITIFIAFFLYKSKGYRKTLILVFLIAASFILLNIVDILLFFDNILYSLGLPIASISKSIVLSDDIGDGRNDLYTLTLSLIKNRPIFGHGLSTFPYYTSGISYPHNFILQFLFDGGFVLLFSILYIFLPPIYNMIAKNFETTKREYPVILLLFGIEITRVCFSGNIWLVSSFWLLLGMIINKKDRQPTQPEVKQCFLKPVDPLVDN